RWAAAIADRVPIFPKSGDVHTLYTLGQNMYVPSDITQESPPLSDRPYAGWLYGSVGLVKETDKQLDQLNLSLGIVGPLAFAEDVQKFVHTVIDSNDPKGWHTQLGNEPALLLSYQRSWREVISRPVKALTLDVTPTLSAALGNVFTHAGAGATLRFGNITPLRPGANGPPLDFGPPRIQPSAPGSGFFFSADRFTWYLFAGVEARAVARNIFLDGNTFGHSRSVNSEPLVGDAQFGFVAAWRDWRASYTHVMRTREFVGQSERDDFGAFSVSVRF
ncbi:MAG: lipid A deacylase LpxR family protein, partial [Alphaproteobacteria bacterium]|nr:lipid A deacylase LpxR family protein [Alphaproteobacteria bacterium]